MDMARRVKSVMGYEAGKACFMFGVFADPVEGVGDVQKGDPVEARLAGSASDATKFGPTLRQPWTSRVYITSLAATGFITAASLICQGAVLTVLTDSGTRRSATRLYSG